MINAEDLPAVRALREQQGAEAQQAQEKYARAPAGAALPVGPRPAATQRSTR